jgi:hypothetical protein
MSFIWTIRCKSCDKDFAYKDSVAGGKTIAWKKPDIELGELTCPYCFQVFRYSSNDMIRQEGEAHYE